MLPSFGTYQPVPSHDEAGMQTESLYLTMRDGVRLAADLHRPASLAADAALPTLIYITRYWRDTDFRPGFRWIGAASLAPWRFLTAHGYAVLTVDARGTGASFGTRAHEWDKAEVQDGGEIAAWIAAQPWSNGKIGAIGTSYSGTTAELLAIHPAVTAVLPRFNEYDVYTDIAFPGGLYLRGFVEQWSQSTAGLDANAARESASTPLLERIVMRLGARGVKPVNGDYAALRTAVADHAGNVHAADLARETIYRDDQSASGVQARDYSVYAYREAIERNGAAIYGWGGWFDAVTADAVIRRWLTVQTPQIAVIGPWNHGASQHASPYAPARANTHQHWQEFLRFFDDRLKGIHTGIDAEIAAKTLTYFTIGEECWKTTTVWPPAGTTPRPYYFAADGALSDTLPAAAGVDEYTVDFEATTGSANRWYTQAGGGAVLYGDRAEADRRLLTYTSAPLPHDLEITGYPVVKLHVSSTADDGAFFVYLEAVEPDGRVTYLTEGMLRALHRKISTGTPPYAQPVPYHSFNRADGAPLVPGAVTEIQFGLLPISVLLRAGQRIRVALAGADASVFPRFPAAGTPTLSVQHGAAAPSHILLPVIDR